MRHPMNRSNVLPEKQIRRYVHLADVLNKQRAQMGIGFIHRRKRITGFKPCQKSIEALANITPEGQRPPGMSGCMDYVTPATQALTIISMTFCECHNGLSYKDIEDIFFEIK